MLQIKKYTSCKSYLKEKPELKKSINKALTRLTELITSYYEQKVPFEMIYSDKIVYDRHGICAVFKCFTGNIQLRLLYAVHIDNNILHLCLVNYFVERNNDKRYLKLFDNANSLSMQAIFHNAISI